VSDGPTEGGRELLVPVFGGGARQGEESLPVADAGAGRFRLLASPGFVEGLAAGDELELADDAPLGYHVLRRGGNLCVWLYFARDVAEGSAEAADARRVAESLGGRVDGGYARMVVLTIPLAAGFAAVEGALDAAVARHAGASWSYGNVYDPRDGETPLDWWR
jgi:hypothetical protein